jgi:hypothetical protein
MKQCGDQVTCGNTIVSCSRPEGHPIVGFNNGKTRRYEFHRGDGWIWDERSGWRDGSEPKEGR